MISPTAADKAGVALADGDGEDEVGVGMAIVVSVHEGIDVPFVIFPYLSV